MGQADSSRERLPRGVTALDRSRGGRRYRASIRRGKGVEAHLGLYETPWQAALAYRVAAQILRRDAGPPVDVPQADQPTAEQVRRITAKVRRRLGVAPERGETEEREQPPTEEELLAFFEVTAVGFWRDRAAADAGDRPGAGLDHAARGLHAAARLLFWSRSPGYPTPLEAMADLLARRLDGAFRRSDLTRAVLDDDGDDPDRLARWLVQPDTFPDGRARGFRAEVRHLYPELFEAASSADDGPLPAWAAVLGVAPPFSPEQIRSAYRARSRSAHPDAGGTPAAFVRLKAAYEDALEYVASMGW